MPPQVRSTLTGCSINLVGQSLSLVTSAHAGFRINFPLVGQSGVTSSVSTCSTKTRFSLSLVGQSECLVAGAYTGIQITFPLDGQVCLASSASSFYSQMGCLLGNGPVFSFVPCVDVLLLTTLLVLGSYRPYWLQYERLSGWIVCIFGCSGLLF